MHCKPVSRSWRLTKRLFPAWDGVWHSDLYRKQIIGWPAYTEMANYAVLQDDPIARMIHHMNLYTCSTIYSVIRTPVWKQAVGISSKKQFSVFALGENQFELAICYQGKSKVIQNLMWLRSGGERYH